MKTYGTLKSDELAEQNKQCREIVREIYDFGVTDRQRLYIMHLLALEIEDVEVMQEITTFIKEHFAKYVFLSDSFESEEQHGKNNT